MSELADEMVRKFPTIEPEYVRALVRLKEENVNQRFLTGPIETPTPRPKISLWSRLANLMKGKP